MTAIVKEKPTIIKQTACYNCEHFLIIYRFSNDPHPQGLENGNYCMLTKEEPLKLEHLKDKCHNQKTWSKQHHCLNCHVERVTTKMALPCAQCGGYYPGDCCCLNCCCEGCKITAAEFERGYEEGF